MKHQCVLTAMMALLSLLAAGADDGGRPAKKPDDSSPLAKKYEEAIRIQNWSWSDDDAEIFRSLGQASSRYDFAIVRPHNDAFSLRLKVLDGQREVYSWRGGRYSVFILQGERLFYVQETNDGESAVVAVDLKACKQLWRSPLRPAVEKTPDGMSPLRVSPLYARMPPFARVCLCRDNAYRKMNSRGPSAKATSPRPRSS
jgi:hypothetical protein